MFAIFLFPCFIEAEICKTLMKIDGYPYSELISEVEAARSRRSSTMDLSFPYSLRKGGLSPMEAIMAATKTNARLIFSEKTLGTLEHGKLADIVVAKGNPLTNIKLLAE